MPGLQSLVTLVSSDLLFATASNLISVLGLQNLATLESTITSPYASPRCMSPVSMSPRATLM